MNAVAVLEAERGVFRQWTVVNVEPGGACLLEGRERLASSGVVEREMALAEGAADGVLARQPDGNAFDDKGAKCERLGMPPVDRCIGAVEGDAAALQGTVELRMDLEVRWEGEQLGVQRF